MGFTHVRNPNEKGDPVAGIAFVVPVTGLHQDNLVAGAGFEPATFGL